MAYKKKSPANYGTESVVRGLKALGSMIPTFSISKYMEAAPGEKFKAATSSGTSMPKTSGPKKLYPGGGVREHTITSEGLKIPGVKSDDRPAYERPGTGSTKVNKTKTKTVKPSSSTNTSTKTNKSTKPITSSDSGDRSGGYLKNTKNFSLGVDLSMPKSKMQTTVTNARSASTDLISGRMSRRDKIAARQSRKTARVKTRVGNQIERIKGRQERAGVRAGAKMAKKDKGVNPGYFDSQKKLDAFESPKATPRTSGAGNISSGSKPGQLRMPATNVTGQKASQGSMKLKPTMSKTQTLSDSQLNRKLNKPAVKKKNTGKTKSLSMTRGEMTKNLTQLATNSTNNDPFLINAQKRAGQ
tara:strand:+ start:731 stop:1801 length:1071 start_codon:yes stop_codon:yes gene_type:complete